MLTGSPVRLAVLFFWFWSGCGSEVVRFKTWSVVARSRMFESGLLGGVSLSGLGIGSVLNR